MYFLKDKNPYDVTCSLLVRSHELVKNNADYDFLADMLQVRVGADRNWCLVGAVRDARGAVDRRTWKRSQRCPWGRVKATSPPMRKMRTAPRTCNAFAGMRRPFTFEIKFQENRLTDTGDVFVEYAVNITL